MPKDTLLKYSRLKERLAGYGKAAIAFSGGVDSSFLLHTARQVLGDRVLALHARMPWQSPDEDEHVGTIARFCDSRLHMLSVDPLQWPEFIANPPDRCYHCKKKLFSLFREQAVLLGFPVLADGTNADDLHQFRPGLAALEELGVKKPLAETGLGKSEIRHLSEECGLTTWNRPPGSCLATRIACGEPVTTDKLCLVRTVEDFLLARGYRGCRARLSGDTLLIELQAVDIERFFLSKTGLEVADTFKSDPIKRVHLDLEGRRELDRSGRFT